MTAYEQAAAKFAEIQKLQAVGVQLFWDSKTKMPASASGGRGEQMGALTNVIHEKSTSPELVGLIASAEQEHNELDDWQSHSRIEWIDHAPIVCCQHGYANRGCVMQAHRNGRISYDGGRQYGRGYQPVGNRRLARIDLSHNDHTRNTAQRVGQPFQCQARETQVRYITYRQRQLAAGCLNRLNREFKPCGHDYLLAGSGRRG